MGQNTAYDSEIVKAMLGPVLGLQVKSTCRADTQYSLHPKDSNDLVLLRAINWAPVSNESIKLTYEGMQELKTSLNQLGQKIRSAYTSDELESFKNKYVTFRPEFIQYKDESGMWIAITPNGYSHLVTPRGLIMVLTEKSGLQVKDLDGQIKTIPPYATYCMVKAIEAEFHDLQHF